MNQECSKLVSSTTVTVPSNWSKPLEGREIYLGLWSQCVQSIMARRASFQGAVHITVVRKKKERVCRYCKPSPLIPSIQTPVSRWYNCTQHGSFLLCQSSLGMAPQKYSEVCFTWFPGYFLNPVKLTIQVNCHNPAPCKRDTQIHSLNHIPPPKGSDLLHKAKPQEPRSPNSCSIFFPRTQVENFLWHKAKSHLWLPGKAETNYVIPWYSGTE